MSKRVIIHKTHEESERYVLEQGFKRTPEERIKWLLEMNKRMQWFNPTQLELKGVVLRLKNEKARSKRYKDLDDLSKLEEAYYKRLKKE